MTRFYRRCFLLAVTVAISACSGNGANAESPSALQTSDAAFDQVVPGPDQAGSDQGAPSCVARAERYPPGQDFDHNPMQSEPLPECVPTCGVERLPGFAVAYSTEALPAGPCETGSPACDMAAWYLCSCGGLGPFNVYRCSCNQQRWSCILIGPGTAGCLCPGGDAGWDAPPG